MFRRTGITLACLLGLVLVAGAAEAEPRRVRSPRVRLFSPPSAARPWDAQESYQLRQPNPYSAYWQQIYPQFYGGFHYRQIYEFGPPGDFGFRGSPW